MVVLDLVVLCNRTAVDLCCTDLGSRGQVDPGSAPVEDLDDKGLEEDTAHIVQVEAGLALE